MFPFCYNCEVHQDALNNNKNYFFKLLITCSCSNESQWFIPLLQHQCDEMVYFVILFFCLCESHDVYFLYAFSTLYVGYSISFRLYIAVVLYIAQMKMKCLESMEVFFFSVINIVNNLMTKALATRATKIFSSAQFISSVCIALCALFICMNQATTTIWSFTLCL